MRRNTLAVLSIVTLCLDSACSGKSTAPPTPTLTSIEITGSTTFTLGSAASLQYSATGRDQSGRPFPTTFSWSSSEVARATVDAMGLVTPVSVGTVEIRATSMGVTAARTLQVLPAPPAPTATAVELDDVTNVGNASDFVVRFTRAGDETRLAEYRVILVKSAAQSTFSLAAAAALPAARYTVVARGAGLAVVPLAAALRDSDGDEIATHTEYTAVVLSIADGARATQHALSSASNTMALTPSTIKITFIADDGVAITDGTKTVLIDALPQTSSVLVNGQAIIWHSAAPGLLARIRDGDPPFDNVAALLITHDHPDHWEASSTTTFLNAHPATTVVAPTSVAAAFAGHARVRALSPVLFHAETTVVDGITIEALRMVHFSNFGVDFSGVENIAFVVTMGGKRILHLADSDFTAANYTPFALTARNIDVAILPAAEFKLTPASIGFVRTHIAPAAIIASHLETKTSEATVKSIWGSDVKVFTSSLQFFRF